MRPFWDPAAELTARIDTNILCPLISHTHSCDNVFPLCSGVSRTVFLMLPSVARVLVWMTWMERILRFKRYFLQDLVGFFQYQLKVKIRTERRFLLSTNLNGSWLKVASLVCVNESRVDFLFYHLLTQSLPWLS